MPAETPAEPWDRWKRPWPEEPTNGDFHFSLAQAYEKLDRIEESLDAYDAYLENAGPDDKRAKIVRRQLEIAKKALAAEKDQQRQARQGQSL